MFATCNLEDGTQIGRFWGDVLFEGTEDEAEDYGIERAGRYDIMLQVGGSRWAVVDASQSVFALMNHSTRPNVHVTKRGYVEIEGGVAEGEELTWNYGKLFGFA